MHALLFAAVLAATYPDAAAWRDDATTLGYQIDAFDKCRGRLAERPRFSGCIKMWDDAYRRVTRMEGYVAGRLAAAPAEADTEEMSRRTKALGERLDAAAQFVQPELKKLGRQKVQANVASEKLLSRYREPLDRVLGSPSPLDPRALWKEAPAPSK